ncbi:MAG: efflux RND transporter periplasmic adaptor subunit [Gammaproteobacteria bacterium]
MNKMLKYVAIFFVIVFGWYGIKKAFFVAFMSQYTPPPVTISATYAKTQTWQSFINSVGTLHAVNGADLSTEVPGIIQDIHFVSGQQVKKGDVIISMRTNLEAASLKSYQAKLELAKMSYEREKTLFDKHVSSQSALDTRQAELLQAEAGVESAQAQIQQKTITAPFDGKLGIRQVDLGQYVPAGTNMISLQALSPLYVNFSLPEQYLADLYPGQKIEISANVKKDKVMAGTITAINSKVDQTTRNIQIQATIPNEKLSLYPGMYGLVKIWLKDKKDTIVVPQTAVSYSLSGDYVFLIKNESKNKNKPLLKAYRAYVKVGERRDNVVAISDGLKLGDQIVTSGQLKLQNGTHIIIDNSVEL